MAWCICLPVKFCWSSRTSLPPPSPLLSTSHTAFCSAQLCWESTHILLAPSKGCPGHSRLPSPMVSGIIVVLCNNCSFHFGLGIWYIMSQMYVCVCIVMCVAAILKCKDFDVCVSFVCVSVHDCCSRRGAYARDLHSPVHSCASNSRPCRSKIRMHALLLTNKRNLKKSLPKGGHQYSWQPTHLHPQALSLPFLNLHTASTDQNSH